jgi:hypothetical protein
MFSKKIISTESFNLINLPEGTYYINIVNKDSRIQTTGKVIKQ